MFKQFIYEIYSLITDCIMHLPFAFVRNIYAKLIFRKFGVGSQISRHVHLISPHRICIGENVFINRNVTLDGRKGLLIGANTDIGEFTSIWSLSHDIDSPNHSTMGGVTTIEDHCWIAPRCVILPGLTIKRGTVVGTSSVVTKSTEEKTLVAGIPAKFIRRRNNDLTYKLSYRIYL